MLKRSLPLLLRMSGRRRRRHRNVVLSRLEGDPDRRRCVRVQLAFEAVKGRVGQVLDWLVEQEGEERDRAEAVVRCILSGGRERMSATSTALGIPEFGQAKGKALPVETNRSGRCDGPDGGSQNRENTYPSADGNHCRTRMF
jgi:hypothetical protein